MPYEIPNLTDIGLPESLWEITTYSQGLILVTGPAGCGKTTTLAALVDRINETQRGHILTVEDPIEYVHTNKESLVNQREVPAHSRSFAKALRQSLREDPDVILVGEMRDLETISLAITASETGHLVLATLHTTTASSTVDRIINAFPPDQQGQIRMMVSDSLKAVISQSLLPRRDGQGRVAAYEILRNTPNVGGLDPRLQDLPDPDRDADRGRRGHDADGRRAAPAGPGRLDRSPRGLRPRDAQGGPGAVPAGRGGSGVVSTPAPRSEARRRRAAGNRIDRFLPILPKRSGSDLHLSVGSPPIIRIDGELERMRYRALSDGDFYNLVGPITPPAIWKTFQETGDVDFAYQMGEEARFRVNLLQQERGSAAVFRLIPSRVPTAEDLNLPPPVAALYAVQRGMILVTGPTGSGKSTSLAAILDRMNKRLAHHVITIEDPIEFIHTNDKSIFTQREIGPDVPSFAEGVKAAIREDPDALLVGEMRDLETMRMALTAAETGLLVFATVHTNSAAKAVDRIIDAFPAQEQEQVRIVLSEVLRGVVAQQLLRKKGGGRVPAFEILLGSTALSNAIREGKTSNINNQIQTGKSKGMISMDQSLTELVRNGVVEGDEALERAIDKESFKTFSGGAAETGRSVGSRSVNTAPPPGRSETSTVPPCSSAMRATIASPNPEPPGFEEKNGRKIFSRSAGATPAPRSPTDKRDLARAAAAPERDGVRQGPLRRPGSPRRRCAADSRWPAAGARRTRRPRRRALRTGRSPPRDRPARSPTPRPPRLPPDPRAPERIPRAWRTGGSRW